MNQLTGESIHSQSNEFPDRHGTTLAVIQRGDFGVSTMACIIALFSIFMTVDVSAETEDPLSNYRVLEWKQLVPEGWEPPLVPESYDEAGLTSVSKSSVVPELDQQLAALAGFMKPVVFEGNMVTELLLVPFLPHHTTQHAHLDANQMVYVYLLEPLQVDNPFNPLWVVGTISTEPAMTDEGPAAYRIENAMTTAYEY